MLGVWGQLDSLFLSSFIYERVGLSKTGLTKLSSKGTSSHQEIRGESKLCLTRLVREHHKESLRRTYVGVEKLQHLGDGW